MPDSEPGVTQHAHGTQHLRALSNLITTSIDKIEALCAERNQTYPSLDLPVTPESEAPDVDVQAEGRVVVAAAAQLIAAVRPPVLGMLTQATQYHVCAAMRVAIRLHVAESLRKAGSQGMHVNDIAAPTNADPSKVARILRVLATKHIFREVAPDVFANNRLSSVLDTGKDVEEILACPEEKYVGTSGITALLEHALDGGLRSSSYLSDVLLDPAWSHSSEPNETAFNKAFATDLPAFEWTALPENAHRRRVLAVGMRGANAQSLNVGSRGAHAVTDGFDWASVPRDSVVVDVGGGTGSKMLPLAKTFGHLRFVIQDRPDVLEHATQFWNVNLPGAISSGTVKIQAHDFFTAQPESVTKPAVFYLCKVLHDWSDERCVIILSHLRDAAGPETQLVVVDGLVSHACASDSTNDIMTTHSMRIPGATVAPPPEPLLHNWGEANIGPYLSDMQMLVSLNGCERTVEGYEGIFGRSGWVLVGVRLQGGLQGTFSTILGVPA